MTSTVALVIGANRGIGYEIARQLFDQGIQVWLGCRDRERGKEAAQAIRDKGRDARFVELDVTSDGSVDLAAKQVRAETPSLDILVNNAGMNFGPPPEASAEKSRSDCSYVRDQLSWSLTRDPSFSAAAARFQAGEDSHDQQRSRLSRTYLGPNQ